MADAKFSFQEKGRIYSPAWMSPEGWIDFISKSKKPYFSVIYFNLNLLQLYKRNQATEI